LENPVFENWFISAPQNNKVIKLWIEEVLTALPNPNKYINKSSDYSKKFNFYFWLTISKN
jgi:hypothetical protein